MFFLNSRTFIFVILSLLQWATINATGCNYVTLVKCFINILDEWTWTLYELKDNVVTINQDQCEHLRQLDKCIQDDGPEPHECTHNEIVLASNTVSDLLTHRKNSGSFLKSYYLLTYACSDEGQELLNEHRECLSTERIGEMTLSAGTYLSEKFLEHPDDEVCQEVNNKLQEYMGAMKGLCDEEAAMIMCKSLTNMFKGLHADKLQHCQFNCPRQIHDHSKGEQFPVEAKPPPLVDPSISQESEVVPGQASPADGTNLNSANANFNNNILPLLFLFVGALILAH